MNNSQHERYRLGPVNLDSLADEIEQEVQEQRFAHRTPIPAQADYHHTPPPALPGPTNVEPRYGDLQRTAVQVIGHAITRLTWKEAEEMGTGIQVKLKEGVPLAAAIQAWAADWEKFE